MRLLKLGATALAAETVHGYLDASPFFLFSTSDFLLPTSQLTSAAHITSSISHTLSQCPSNLYIIISQPGVAADDYSQALTPALYHRISSSPGVSHIRSSASIKEVVGKVNSQEWRDVLELHCTKWTMDLAVGSSPEIDSKVGPGLININMAAPEDMGELREKVMTKNDVLLASLFDELELHSYTILYTTTPPSIGKTITLEETLEYEMEESIEFPLDAMHIELKRHLERRKGETVYENQTMVDGPLFEKYQFFTPGIFMCLTVGIILLSILYTGISALASLQVSYLAFDKEVVQATAKKA